MSTPTPTDDPNPLETLKRRIRQVCGRIVQGTAAIRRWEVTLQRTVRVVSIILTSLGSAGVIVDKVSNKLPQEIGWAFWGSVIVLVFGVLLQVLNEFKIEQTATEAIALHEACAVFETQLGMLLEDADPRAAVDRLRQEIYAVILKYHRAAPPITKDLAQRADELAVKLITANEGGWKLPRSKRPTSRRPSPPDELTS
jgi:hypothetical protein